MVQDDDDDVVQAHGPIFLTSLTADSSEQCTNGTFLSLLMKQPSLFQKFDQGLLMCVLSDPLRIFYRVVEAQIRGHFDNSDLFL